MERDKEELIRVYLGHRCPKVKFPILGWIMLRKKDPFLKKRNRQQLNFKFQFYKYNYFREERRTKPLLTAFTHFWEAVASDKSYTAQIS
jgi:uncharacterized Tic20 family protein